MSYVIKRFSRLFFASLTSLPLLVNAADIGEFTQCIDNLKIKADAGGYSSYIINEIIPSLAPIKRVIELDKKQPEFSQSFADYLRLRLTNYHIQTGRKKLAQHKNKIVI